jgi:hypothetical protein
LTSAAPLKANRRSDRADAGAGRARTRLGVLEDRREADSRGPGTGGGAGSGTGTGLGSGDASQSRGVSAGFTWRGTRPSVRLNAFSAEQQPSASRSPTPVPPTANLDVHLSGGELAVDDAAQYDTYAYHYRIGVSAAAGQYVGQSAAVLSTTSTPRTLAFADASGSWSKRGDSWAASVLLGSSGTGGKSFDQSFTRGTASTGFAFRGFGFR